VSQAKLQIHGTVNDDGVPNNDGLLAALENDQLPNRKNSRRQSGNNIVVTTDYGVGWDSQDWSGGY
jgi:hypothetical protein